MSTSTKSALVAANSAFWASACFTALILTPTVYFTAILTYINS